ncbi:MAG TPA: hypothetical protein VJA25_06165 [Dehalococcoidia bacterium]|nr:hypothetical protein [Dehalococcoidia bacterium]
MPAFGTLKRDLAALMGQILREGTIDSAAAGTFVDAALTEPDDHYNDLVVYVYTGTGIGQERRIYDWVQSTSTASITGNWTTNPVAGDKYYIARREWSNAAYEGALLQAIRWLRRDLLLPIEDVSKTMGDPGVAAGYTVAVPTGMITISEILREGELATTYDLVLPGPNRSDSPWWYLSRSGTTYNIILDKRIHDSNGFIINGRKLKIIGQQYQAEPTSDSSTISVNPAPIVSLAAALLRLSTQVNPDLVLQAINGFRGATRRLGGGVWADAIPIEES